VYTRGRSVQLRSHKETCRKKKGERKFVAPFEGFSLTEVEGPRGVGKERKKWFTPVLSESGGGRET